MARGKGRPIERADTLVAGLGGADTMSAVVSGATARRSVRTGDATDAATDPGSGGHGIDVEAGTRIGRYVVLSPLGAGGMSRVFRAFDPKLGRQVALKVVTPRHTEAWTADDERARVVREAQAIAKLSHPNVVAVHDVGVDGPLVFIAMELVAGRTLREWQRAGIRTWRDTVAVYVQAGRGLAAAHAAGLIHRDFKPENVLVGDDGRARVVDFGLARTTIDAVTTPDSISAEDLDLVSISQPLSPLTRAGAVLGTPGYMPPEQYGGGITDDKSDQFSFCVSLFEALWGRRPFPGRTVAEIRQQVMAGTIAEPRGTVPARIRHLVMRGLRIARDERHPSMAVLLADLERLAAPRRIGRALATGAAITGIAIAALAVASRSEAPSPCRGSARKLEGVWDPSIRDRLGALFTSDPARPVATWDRVRRDLDGYAGRWEHHHRQVCEATRVHGEQSEQALDLRMACLERQLGDVRELTGLLLAGDRGALERAAVASRHLPDLAECDDLRSLEAVAPPPADFTARAELATVEADVARARALADAGKLADARTTADASLVTARRIGHAPVLARALFTRGVIARLEGDGTAGRTHMFDALASAEEAGDDALAAHAAAELVFIAGYLADAPDDGLAFARLSEAILRRVGGRDAVAGMLHNNLGVLHMQAQRYAESATELERGLALREKVYGPDAFDLVASLNNLGSALTELGRNHEARGHFERAARILDGLFGPVHPHRAAVLVNLALAETELGLADAALAHYREAQGIYEQVVGSAHPMLVPALTNQADLLADIGRTDEALPIYQRAIAIREGAHGGDHPSVALALLGHGSALRQAGRLDQAAAQLERAQRIWVKARGEGDVDVARALHQLGAVRLSQKRVGDARTLLERAIAIDEKVLGKDHRALVPVLTSLGQARLAGGDRAGAVVALERALAIAEARALPITDVAAANFALAQALWSDVPERPRARAQAQVARAAAASMGKLGAAQLVEIDAWLAARP
jgi:tetratricopeptide (TPR) repeat protein/tRNA A-37 threonylcarbamoyl transferase component Bud32